MNTNEKFLPIGTVCSIRGSNKKVMITGYFSVEYAGSVKMYDYSGCDYPEGLLLRNKENSFNHSDIQSVEHMGYVADEYQKFNALLNSQRAEEEKEYQTKDVLANIKFDENGVVVYAPIESPNSSNINTMALKPETENTRRLEVDNPFRPIHVEGSEQAAPAADQTGSENWSIFKTIEFDENGVVISAVERTEE